MDEKKTYNGTHSLSPRDQATLDKWSQKLKSARNMPMESEEGKAIVDEAKRRIREIGEWVQSEIRK